jgi:hypothetical protein
MVLTILSNIGPKFSIFISTFHTFIFSFGATWKMPSLEDFIESLTQDQTKLINMGTIKGPRVHEIIVHDGSQKYHKSKYRYNRKYHACPRRKGTQNPSSMPPDPKDKREEKERNKHIVIKYSIRNTHACKKKFLMSQIL